MGPAGRLPAGFLMTFLVTSKSIVGSVVGLGVIHLILCECDNAGKEIPLPPDQIRCVCYSSEHYETSRVRTNTRLRRLHPRTGLSPAASLDF